MDLDRVAYDYENRQSYRIKYSFFLPFILLIFSRERERGSARASAVDGYQKYWHAARSWGAGCSRGERDLSGSECRELANRPPDPNMLISYASHHNHVYENMFVKLAKITKGDTANQPLTTLLSER